MCHRLRVAPTNVPLGASTGLVWEDGPMRDSVPWMRWVLCALTGPTDRSATVTPAPCISAQGCCPPCVGTTQLTHRCLPGGAGTSEGIPTLFTRASEGCDGFGGLGRGNEVSFRLGPSYGILTLAYVRYFHLYLKYKQLFWSRRNAVTEANGPDRNVTLGASTPQAGLLPLEALPPRQHRSSHRSELWIQQFPAHQTAPHLHARPSGSLLVFKAGDTGFLRCFLLASGTLGMDKTSDGASPLGTWSAPPPQSLLWWCSHSTTLSSAKVELKC